MGQSKAIEPNVNDVLCGRGGYINSHPGNERFRKLVDKRKRVYLAARFKQEKRLVANSIVSDIRDIGGRFLAKNNSTGEWHDIGDDKSRDKTSQALRENAPIIRAEIVEGANQLRTRKSGKEGSKTLSINRTSTKTQTKSKGGRKNPSMGFSEPAFSREPPPSYYQQCYPPPLGYAPYYHYPTPTCGYSEGMYNMHTSGEGDIPSYHSMPPTTAPDTFHSNHNGHSQTEYVHSSQEGTLKSSYRKETLWGSNHSHPRFSTDERLPWSPRSPFPTQAPPLEARQVSCDQSEGDHLQTETLDYQTNHLEHHDGDACQNGNHSSVLLMQAANQIMGWDRNRRMKEDPIEDEIGQEVELVETDCYSDECHKAPYIDQMMAQQTTRPLPRPRTNDADWSQVLGCQSSWLPDSFAGYSSTKMVSSPHEGVDMRQPVVEGGGISQGNSMYNGFAQEQDIYGGGTVQAQHSNSSRGPASSTHQDSSKMGTYRHNYTVSNNGRCRSPSILEQSLGTRSGGYRCHLSPIATTKNSVQTSVFSSRSRSGGSRSSFHHVVRD